MADTPEKASAKMRKDIETGRRGFIVSPSAEVSGASGPLPIPAKQGEGLASILKRIIDANDACVEPSTTGRDMADYLEAIEDGRQALANLTEQDEAPPLDEWQPSEDAPKDGTVVLLWGKSIRNQPVLGSWDGDEWETAEHHSIDPTHFKPIGNLPNAEPATSTDEEDA